MNALVSAWLGCAFLRAHDTTVFSCRLSPAGSRDEWKFRLS
jgi:hypothetical protein